MEQDIFSKIEEAEKKMAAELKIKDSEIEKLKQNLQFEKDKVVKTEREKKLMAQKAKDIENEIKQKEEIEKIA